MAAAQRQHSAAQRDTTGATCLWVGHVSPQIARLAPWLVVKAGEGGTALGKKRQAGEGAESQPQDCRERLQQAQRGCKPSLRPDGGGVVLAAVRAVAGGARGTGATKRALCVLADCALAAAGGAAHAFVDVKRAAGALEAEGS